MPSLERNSITCPTVRPAREGAGGDLRFELGPTMQPGLQFRIG